VFDPGISNGAEFAGGVRNVGIKGGKIAAITKDKIAGKETIDATGLVVAPGFIDGHQHCQEPYAHRLVPSGGELWLR